MSISTTQLLGTDSISGSRPVINNNFQTVTSEINAIENYINPDTGSITGVNEIKTNSLRVGLNTPLLNINSNNFDILTSIKINGDINLNGGRLIRNNIDDEIINDTFVGPSLNFAIGTGSTAPEYSIIRVGNSNNTDPLNLSLYDGIKGQELVFIYSESTTGDVSIQGAINPLILNGGSTVTLNNQGQSVHLISIIDNSNNTNWFIIGGNGYTIS